MARLADIQATRLAGALLAGDVVKVDAPFTLISRRKVRFWIGASATLAAIILVSWKVESHDPQSSGLSLGALSPIQEKDMKFTQAMSVAVAAGSICSGVMAQSTAVQWTAASGGNGHWYGVTVATSSVSWTTAQSISLAAGGYLACLTSATENAWVNSLTVNTPGAWYVHPSWTFGPWIGGYRDGESSPNWKWVSGEPWTFTAWHLSQPDAVSQTVVSFGPTAETWSDTEITEPVRSYVTEYSADCNSDGIVDYGQILSGQLTDTNSNGIPDICEIDPCPGDINLNSIVDAVDLAMVLTSWGTSGGDYPRADVNHDGIVNGPDLGALLGGWGICP